MGNAGNDRRIDYIEFQATDIPATKRFYGDLFGWKFEEYGPDYISFSDGRIAGGYSKTDRAITPGPLTVIYAVDLKAMEATIRAAGESSGSPRSHFRAGADSTLPTRTGMSWRYGRSSKDGERLPVEEPLRRRQWERAGGVVGAVKTNADAFSSAGR